MDFLLRAAGQLVRVPGWDEWVVIGPREVEERYEAMRFRPARGVHSLATFRFVEADHPIGEARNVCADMARGDIIVQIDDDDWQGSHRVVRSAQLLTLNPKVRLVGTTWLYALFSHNAEVIRMPIWNVRGMLPGATLAYRKEAWAAHPFLPGVHPLFKGFAEDGDFTSYFYDRGESLDACDPAMLVYLRHHQNISEPWFEIPHTPILTPHQILEERRRNPSKPMRTFDDSPARDAKLRDHNSEVYGAYVRGLMGSEFSWFLDEGGFIR